MISPKNFEVTLSYGDGDYVVLGTITPGFPEVRYLRNGDPGYPEEPAEAEIDVIRCENMDMNRGTVEKLLCDDAFYALVLDKAEALCSEEDEG